MALDVGAGDVVVGLDSAAALDVVADVAVADVAVADVVAADVVAADVVADGASSQDGALADGATDDAATEDTGSGDTGLGEVVDLDANPVACSASSECPLPSVPCQQRLCQAGSCVFVAAPDALVCNIGSACITKSACSAGKCVTLAEKSCDDGSACTEDNCKISTGLCTHTPTKAGFVCDDGNKCTKTAECFSGVCVAQGFFACDDGNPCTTDFCDPKTGKCLAKPGSKGTACDDGNTCSSGDTCSEFGLCVGGKNTCSCSTTADCALKEDGDACNGTLFCEPTSGTCQVNQSTVVACPKLASGACQTTACNPATGKCQVGDVANGASCDDGNPCTTPDECDQGDCKGVNNTCGCLSDAECKGQQSGDLCAGQLFCDKSAAPFTCKVNPTTVVVCATAKDSYCSKNTCEPTTGLCKPVAEPNKAPCEDGDTCTTGDYCLAGNCKAGTDTCKCGVDSDCATLEDGSLCNGTLFCNIGTGQCELNPATVVQCPTLNDTYCIQTVCEPKTGKCQMTAQHETKACDDGNVCSEGEICSKGACTGGTNVCKCTVDADCKDDGNLCNGVSFCDKKVGQCKHNPSTEITCPSVDDDLCSVNTCLAKTGQCKVLPRNTGLACDADGNGCTKNDVCQGGTCVADVNTCQCQKDLDCGKFEADDLCSKLYCEPKSHQCKPNPNTQVVCLKSSDDLCAANVCQKATGKCAMEPRNQGQACDADGSNCTVGDACDKGSCTAGTNACGCTKDADCKSKEDGNPCTGTLICGNSKKCQVNPATVVLCQAGSDTSCIKNTCDAKTGQCALLPINYKSPCGKGTLCSGVPLCDEKGGCKGGVVVDCDDHSPCTVDSCDDYKGCQYKDVTGVSCDDGSVCTTKDLCVKGKCTGQSTPCLGGTPCTLDSCHPLKGCQYEAKTGSCDDGNKCTDQESCVGKYCIGTAIACNDGNLCTTDSCSPTNGCVFTANSFVCNDGDLCTKQDGCKSGNCVGLPLVVTEDCADSNPCTDESCNALKGCLWIKTTKLCDDGDPCSTGDICANGVCQKGDGAKCDDKNGCTADACDPKTGVCSNLPLGSTVTCDDGDPRTLGDVCGGGACKSGKVNTCDDGDGCTSDSCSPTSGCKHTFSSGGTCDDGNKCTSDDGCVQGKCTGTVIKCTGGSACTVDSCHPLLGCVYTPVDELCDDGNPCTASDACKNGVCVGVAATCNDKNPCTDDTCAAKVGCVFTANSASCDDDDLCTKQDGCAGGKCVGLALQLTVDCDDGIFCTDDLCSKTVGCYHTKPSKPCSDDDLCSTGDTCKGGACVGGTGNLCDDGNKCTLDSCTKGKCTFAIPPLYYQCDDGDPCTLDSRCELGVCYTSTAGKPNPKYNACPIPKGNSGYNQAANFKTWWATCCDADGKCCASADDRCHQKDLVFVQACKNCATHLNAVSNKLNCNDSNPCTNDTCVAGKGCVHTPVSGAPSCSDGKPCTEKAACKDSSCQKTVDKVCDDNNPCTTDVCIAGKGCSAATLPDGVVCEKGGAATCSTQGVCKSGTCDGATARPWTIATPGNLRNCTEIAAMSDNGWLLVGMKEVDGVNLPAWMRVRYNGSVLWERTLDHKAEGQLLGMSDDGKGAFSAVGRTKDNTLGGNEGLFVRFGADQQVTHQVVFAGLKEELLQGIATTKDGGHVLVGQTSSKGSGGDEGWLIRLDAKDQVVWENVVGSVVDDQLFAVALRSDGGVFAAGNSGNYAGWLLRYDAAGKLVGEKRHGDSKTNTYRFDGIKLWSDTSLSTTGDRLRTWNDSLDAASGFTINSAVADIVTRPKGGYGLLNGGIRITDSNLGVTWTAKTNPGGQRRVLAPDDDSLIVMTSATCGLVRTDGFGNVTCGESGECYLKSWADCQDTDACTKAETCGAGKCSNVTTVCNDNKVCTSDKCDSASGKCIYTPTDGAACSSTDSECAIEGECLAGVCYNDNVVAWTLQFLPFYGCCGDNNNSSNEYQGTRLMAVAPRADGQLFVAGPGYNRNNTNSLYGKLVQGTAGVPGKYNSTSGARYSYFDRTGDSNSTWATDFSVVGAVSFKNLVSAGLSRYKLHSSETKYEWLTMLRLNNGNGKSLRLGGHDTEPVDMEATGDYTAASLARHKDAGKWATAVYFTQHGDANSPLGWDYPPKLLGTAVHHIGDDDKPVGLSPVEDGKSVVVAGDVHTSADKTWRHYAARIGTDGKLIWQKSWDVASYSALKAVGWSQLGVILTGQKRVVISGTTAYFIWLRRLDSSGNLLWDKSLTPSTYDNYGWAVVPKPSGFAVGAVIENQNALLRFDNAGAMTGDKRFGGWTDKRLEDWKALPDGFVAAGWKQSGSSYQNKWKQNGFIIRTDPFGNAPCDKVGKCMGKKFSDCDDNNPCTGDSCDAAVGCIHFGVSEGVGCQDGDPCTAGSACANGKCAGATPLAQAAACDDGDACTKSSKCNWANKCVGTAVCDDGKPCTADACKDGQCTHSAIKAGDACDDGDYCTETTTCDAQAACSGGKQVCKETVVID